jgi:hypothetical protein
MWREKNSKGCRLGQEEKGEGVEGGETLEDTQPPGSNGARQNQHADPTIDEDQRTQTAISTASTVERRVRTLGNELRRTTPAR